MTQDKKYIEFIEEAIKEEAQRHIKIQQESIEMAQAELDGRLWNTSDW